jgi:hypothetical protein
MRMVNCALLTLFLVAFTFGQESGMPSVAQVRLTSVQECATGSRRSFALSLEFELRVKNPSHNRELKLARDIEIERIQISTEAQSQEGSRLIIDKEFEFINDKDHVVPTEGTAPEPLHSIPPRSELILFRATTVLVPLDLVKPSQIVHVKVFFQGTAQHTRAAVFSKAESGLIPVTLTVAPRRCN